MVPWAESSGFEAKLPDGRLIGPFNTILASPEIASSFLALPASEQEHTSLSERVRQVVILTVGTVWESDYDARRAGLSEDAIRALSQVDEADDLMQRSGSHSTLPGS